MTQHEFTRRIRIGAIGYLNARPLTYALPALAPQAEILYDVPSRLADALAAGRLEVAMIPSIEYLRQPDYTNLSDACIASRGPVLSVRLYGRVPVERIRTVALDEGSRTSAVLVRILLKERWQLQPEIRPLPIGASVAEIPADAVLLIGDRGIAPTDGRFEFVWDLGEEWFAWTGLPFVFALWTARPDAALSGVAEILSAARDEGVRRLPEIAREEAPKLGMAEAHCLTYLREHLYFYFGAEERQGLQRFCELAGRHGWIPAGRPSLIHKAATAGCQSPDATAGRQSPGATAGRGFIGSHDSRHSR